MAQVFAPFTPQQVTALDHWQNGGMAVHPFTCGNDHPEPRNLIPTRDGWVCSVCAYTQSWAHDFMLASADTRPEGGDATEIAAPFTSGAVGAPSAETPKGGDA